MKAYNKKRKPKHEAKPRYFIDCIFYFNKYIDNFESRPFKIKD